MTEMSTTEQDQFSATATTVLQYVTEVKSVCQQCVYLGLHVE